MSKELALPKKAYLITLSAWQPETVLLEKEPDWKKLLEEKHIVKLDWIFINAAYIVSVKEVSLSDTNIDSADAYARSLKWAFKIVAMERVRKYESSNWKMSLSKIKDRMQSFHTSGKSGLFLENWRYDLYLQNDGDPDLIWW